MLRLILLLCLFSAKFGFGTQYHHYSWNEIFNKTHLALKVKVLSANFYYAKVEVLEVYNTEFESKEIWVTRTGINIENSNQSFLIFLSDTLKEINKNYWSPEYHSELEKINTPEFQEALKKNQVYYGFGLSGSYTIKDNKIAINLSNPHMHKNEIMHPLAEIETMLEAAFYPEKDWGNFHESIINQLNQKQTTEKYIHYLKILSLSQNKKWFAIFKHLTLFKNNELQLALIENLVKIEDVSSKNLLRHYWNQNDPFYSEKIITELVTTKNTQFAPQILHTLDSIITISKDLNTAEKPVNYHEIQGPLYYFKNIPDYEAIPTLQKLLVCKNTKIIDRTILALELNQDSSYVDVILEQVENEPMNNQLICSYAISASKFELEQLYEPLIKKCFANKADPFSAITAGIIFEFNQTLAEPLFIDQLARTIEEHSHLPSHIYGQVFQKYLGLCYRYEISKTKELVYKAYSEYTGHGYEFRENPNLFDRKRQIQDSLNSLFKKQLKPLDYAYFETHVRLQSNSEFDYYVSVVYPNFSRNVHEDTIRAKSILRRELCASYLNIPISKIETRTTNNRNAYYDSEFYLAVKNNQSRIFNSFYSYLIDFGDKKDLTFLKNLRESESKYFGSSLYQTISEVEKELKQELKTK